tara:strand:+ start:425 stop:919 length:495 start_codon:yes stop_codon:yes gene_type:complete
MAVPIWLRGQEVSLVKVEPQNLTEATGVLGDVTGPAQTATITAVLDGAVVRPRAQTEEISPITVVREHHEHTKVGGEIVLTEILRDDASLLGASPTGPQLAAIADYFQDQANEPYARVVITRVGTWTGFGLFVSYEEGLIAKGKNVGQMTFIMIDNGVVPINYT